MGHNKLSQIDKHFHTRFHISQGGLGSTGKQSHQPRCRWMSGGNLVQGLGQGLPGVTVQKGHVHDHLPEKIKKNISIP